MYRLCLMVHVLIVPFKFRAFFLLHLSIFYIIHLTDPQWCLFGFFHFDFDDEVKKEKGKVKEERESKEAKSEGTESFVSRYRAQSGEEIIAQRSLWNVVVDCFFFFRSILINSTCFRMFFCSSFNEVLVWFLYNSECGYVRVQNCLACPTQPTW